MKVFNVKYKKSRWVYLFRKDKRLTLFNSNNLEIFFVDKETVKLFNMFNKPQKPKEALSFFREDKEILAKKTVNKLIHYRFLVPEEENEDHLLDKWIKSEIRSKKEELGNSTMLDAFRIILTEKCNLRCKYCFVRGKKEISLKDMNLRTLIGGINLLTSLSGGRSIELQFFGGEPLVKFDLITKAVEYVNRLIRKGVLKKAFYGITTNATLVTDKQANFLKKNKFLVSVSLDGWENIHNANRVYMSGNGSYNHVVAGLNILKKYKNEIGILVTPSKNNIDYLSKACKFIVQDLGFKFLTINTPQPVNGNWEIDGEKFSKELKKCYTIAQQNNAIINHFGTRTLFALNLKQPMILSCSKYGNNFTATLTTDGKISPCIVSWEYKEALVPLRRFSYSSSFIDWKLTKPYFLQRCKKCPAMNVCGGPCPLEVYEMKKCSKKIKFERCRFFNDYLKWAIWLNK